MVKKRVDRERIAHDRSGRNDSNTSTPHRGYSEKRETDYDADTEDYYNDEVEQKNARRRYGRQRDYNGDYQERNNHDRYLEEYDDEPGYNQRRVEYDKGNNYRGGRRRRMGFGGLNRERNSRGNFHNGDNAGRYENGRSAYNNGNGGYGMNRRRSHDRSNGHGIYNYGNSGRKNNFEPGEDHIGYDQRRRSRNYNDYDDSNFASSGTGRRRYFDEYDQDEDTTTKSRSSSSRSASSKSRGSRNSSPVSKKSRIKNKTGDRTKKRKSSSR